MNQAKSTKQQVQHSLGPKVPWFHLNLCTIPKKKKKNPHLYNRLLKNWWPPLKQPDIACMKVGLHSNIYWTTKTCLCSPIYVSTNFFLFFLEILTQSRTNQSLQICLCFWRLEKQVLKLMCENPLVCVVMTDGCTAWLWLPNSTVPSKYESYFEFCFFEYYFIAFQHKHITKANHIN